MLMLPLFTSAMYSYIGSPLLQLPGKNLVGRVGVVLDGIGLPTVWDCEWNPSLATATNRQDLALREQRLDQRVRIIVTRCLVGGAVVAEQVPRIPAHRGRVGEGVLAQTHSHLDADVPLALVGREVLAPLRERGVVGVGKHRSATLGVIRLVSYRDVLRRADPGLGAGRGGWLDGSCRRHGCRGYSRRRRGLAVACPRAGHQGGSGSRDKKRSFHVRPLHIDHDPRSHGGSQSN